MSRSNRPLVLRQYWRLVLAAALVCGTVSTQSVEQRTKDQECEDRAAMLRAHALLKIAPYITAATAVSAPAEPALQATKGKRYRVGVVGSDAVAAAALRELPGKKVDNAVVTVTELTPKAAADGKAAAEFDLLWIAASVDEVTLACIVAAHRDKPVVLVCERAGFIGLGGGVQLFCKDDCVRFEVNGDALKRQGLRPSAQLLKLSRKGPCR